jgi:hypothetical protein
VTDIPSAPELAKKLVAAAGDTVGAILLYGSHLLRTNPDRHSAFDFVVIVDAYRPFYSSLKAAGEIHRPVRLMTWMAGVLSPNVIAFTPNQGRAGIAKCLIVTREDFAAALGPNPKDHFLLGRMIQKVGIVWVRSPDDEEWVESRLRDARSGVLEWMAPYLDGPVDAEGLGRQMMAVCYQGELRPEASDRSVRVFEAQAEHFRAHFTEVLQRGEDSGLLRREGEGFVLAGPVDSGARRRWSRHFSRSKARATARWLKHTATFDNWLPYVIRKVERHTGTTVELTAIERRLPLIFLWPRAIKLLMTRRPKGGSE